MEASAPIDGDELTQHPAFNALQCMFSDNKDNVLEIEILPSSFVFPEGQILLQEDLSIGIPKKVLVTAFLRAREVFAVRSSSLGEKSYEVSFLVTIYLHIGLIVIQRTQGWQPQSCSYLIRSI